MADGDDKPWFDGLDDDLQKSIVAKGWDKVDGNTAAKAIALAYQGAQKLIGVPAEQIVRLPKDASDPAYMEAYKRVAEMGAPKEATGYSFDGVKRKDGSAMPEDDAKFVRELALELKLPVNAAASMAQRIVERAEGASAAEAEKKAISVAADQATLRGMWGSSYDINDFRVRKVSESLGWDKDVVDTLHVTVGGTKVLNGLLQLAGQMGEAPFLKGETSHGQGSMTKEQARERKAALTGDEAFVKKYLAGGADERKTLEDLDRIIVSR